MNTERILELADHIEKLEHYPEEELPNKSPDYFSMDQWQFDCGAPACMAGHACHLWGGLGSSQIYGQARDALDLDRSTASSLFSPNPGYQEYSEFYLSITPAIAAGVLRNLALTGEVVWPDELGWSRESYEP